MPFIYLLMSSWRRYEQVLKSTLFSVLQMQAWWDGINSKCTLLSQLLPSQTMACHFSFSLYFLSSACFSPQPENFFINLFRLEPNYTLGFSLEDMSFVLRFILGGSAGQIAQKLRTLLSLMEDRIRMGAHTLYNSSSRASSAPLRPSQASGHEPGVNTHIQAKHLQTSNKSKFFFFKFLF